MSRLVRLIAMLTAASLLAVGCSTQSPPASSETQTQPSAEAESTPSAAPPELIGGGTEIFPDRRFIALYGHPEYPELGALGEQGPQASVERVIELAEMYEAHASENIIPAFEIIATMASASPGADGNYSAVAIKRWKPMWTPQQNMMCMWCWTFSPVAIFWSGKTLEPTDPPQRGTGPGPRWRLAPGQRHMEQIGSVVPQKLTNHAVVSRTDGQTRPAPETGHPASIPTVNDPQARASRHQPPRTGHVFADGHAPPNKMATWRSLRKTSPTTCTWPGRTSSARITPCSPS